VKRALIEHTEGQPLFLEGPFGAWSKRGVYGRSGGDLRLTREVQQGDGAVNGAGDPGGSYRPADLTKIGASDSLSDREGRAVHCCGQFAALSDGDIQPACSAPGAEMAITPINLSPSPELHLQACPDPPTWSTAPAQDRVSHCKAARRRIGGCTRRAGTSMARGWPATRSALSGGAAAVAYCRQAGGRPQARRCVRRPLVRAGPLGRSVPALTRASEPVDDLRGRHLRAC